MQIRYFRAIQPCRDGKRSQFDEQSPGSRRESVFRAGLRYELQPGYSADLKEGLEMSRDLGRGKQVEPLAITGSFALSFFDRCVEKSRITRSSDIIMTPFRESACRGTYSGLV